jgi:tetratricopeptide (TPR) repeat protein
MRFPLISCGLAMLLSVATWLSAAPEGDPAERLQALVARQRELLAAAERKTSQNELEDLRQPLQELCFAYEDYLRAFPDQAVGYASYALLLDHPIIDERRRSTALFLRANQLNPEMALVKNQLGNHLAEDGKPLEAVNYYLAAIRLEPKESLYHYQLGTLLAEARDDFLKSGEWAREKLDAALISAFREAMNLAPDNWRYAYRFGLAFYDVDQPDWAEALGFWQSFESRVKPGIEQQTCRIHQARIHLARGERDRARAILETVTESVLDRQKAKLIAELDAPK